jgi:phosphate-selective porin OprO and OprP
VKSPLADNHGNTKHFEISGRGVIERWKQETKNMNPCRIFRFASSTITIWAAILIILIQTGAAQEKKAEEATSIPNMNEIAERLKAVEARLRGLEDRINALQTPAAAVSSTVNSDVAGSRQTAIEVQIQDLDQKIRIVERRKELEKESLAETAKSAAIVSANKDGFVISSADKNFQLKFDGYLQADSRFFVGHPSPAVETFQIGRARPVFQGTLFKYFDFRIMPDFAGGQTVLQDLQLDFTAIPGAKLRFGKFKSPLGLEVLQGDTDLTFITRSLTSALLPSRDAGAQVFSDVAGGAMSYAFGILNGVPDGASADLDSNDGKDMVGRLFTQPFKNSQLSILKSLGIGVGASDGSQQGSLPSYKTSGQAVYFSYSSGVMADGNRRRISPQAYYYAGPFGMMTEYAMSAQDVRKGASSGRIQNRSWHVSASYAIGGKPSYRAVNPKKVFNPKEKSFGALEFAARYSSLRIDREAFSSGFADITKSARQADEFVFGVNWYLTKMVKFVLDYSQTRFEGGSPSGDRASEQAVMTRFQIGF